MKKVKSKRPVRTKLDFIELLTKKQFKKTNNKQKRSSNSDKNINLVSNLFRCVNSYGAIALFLR